MTRGTRIALVVAGLMVAGSVPTIIGYVRAYRDRGKVSPGMSLTSVFGAVEGWNLCINSYLDESTKEFGTFSIAKDPGAPTYRAANEQRQELEQSVHILRGPGAKHLPGGLRCERQGGECIGDGGRTVEFTAASRIGRRRLQLSRRRRVRGPGFLRSRHREIL